MKTGKVKFYLKEKGFGFIIDNETGDEIFVHKNDITGIINKDNAVTFDVAKGKKGLQAVNVEIA